MIFGEKILVQRNFLWLDFGDKILRHNDKVLDKPDKNFKLLVLGASNMALKFSEVSEIVSLTPNTI